MKGKILIVEDEKKLGTVMSLYLEKEGYAVVHALSGEIAEELMSYEKFDIVILDVMLPQKDGWSILRKIKSSGNTPVILTTARAEEDDRIFGFELGADDYMVKPISMRELVLKVNLRIKGTASNDSVISLGNMRVSINERTAMEGDVAISLTPKEFDLLLILVQNKGQVFTRSQLLDKVWGYDFSGDTRTVDTHIKNLREKSRFCHENLKTVWGVGYKMDYSS